MQPYHMIQQSHSGVYPEKAIRKGTYNNYFSSPFEKSLKIIALIIYYIYNPFISDKHDTKIERTMEINFY